MSKQESSKSKDKSFVKLAETIPTAIIKLNKDGHFVYLNEKAEEVMGLEESEIMDRTYNDLDWKITNFKGNELTEEKLPFQIVKSTEQPVSDVGYAIERRNGERTLLSVNATPLFDDEDNFNGMIAVMEDVTESYSAEKAEEELLKDLRERNKELKLLYEIAELAGSEDISLREFLQRAVEKIPPGWQYPEETCARISYESEEFKTEDFRRTEWSQTTTLKVDGEEVGTVEVYYLSEKPPMDEGPFLSEERELINSLTRLLGQSISKNRSEARKDRLNSVLRSVRDIDRLLVKTGDREELVEGACESLFKTRGYLLTWIGLLNNSNQLVSYTQRGFGDDFDELIEQIESDDLPSCLQQALNQSGVVVISDRSSECSDCPLADKSYNDCSTLVAGLEYSGNNYGVLAAVVPSRFADDEEEQTLFLEVARDIGYGLYDLEVGEKLKRQEAQLTRSQQLAKVGSWRIDLETGQLEWSEETHRIFDVPLHKNLTYEDFLGFVHPEDRDYVEEKWNKALEDNEEIDIQFRIVTDGGTKWVREKAEINSNRQGESRQVMGSVQDITERKEAKNELEESEAKFRAIAEQAHDGLFIFSEDKLEWLNGSVSEILDYSEEELYQKSIWSLIHPEDRDRVKEIHRKGVEGIEAPPTYEARVVRKDGEVRNCEFAVTQIEYSGKQVFLGAIRDITERRRAEEEIRESEEKFRSYVENAPIGVFLADKEGDYIDVNPEACEMTGYSEEELLDMKIPDLHPKEAQEDAKSSFEELLEKGEVRKELAYLRKDGSTGHMIVNAVELSEDRFIAFTEDTTERRKAYRKLKQSQKRFKNMADLLPLPVWEADLDKKITYLNRAGLEEFAYSQKEIEEGISVLDFVAPEDRERAIENFKEIVQSGEIKNAEYTLIKDNDTLITALTFSSPIKRGDEIKGARGVVLDITERREAHERLKQATIGTLQALNRTIEAKDEYTGEHIDRVQKFSVRIGKELDLSEERLEQLRYASILHDIGKIGVPDSILGKSGKLTEEEWEKMEKHPKTGERIVGQVDQLSWAAKIIGQHQEKYDGTGYPRGLKEDEITLEARIIAVADAWDAMRTDRPYREALPKEEAVRELEENVGTQFDPEIVDIMLDLTFPGEKSACFSWRMNRPI